MRPVALGLLLFLLAGAAGAQRISLDVNDMALPDVVTAIKQLSGVQIIGEMAVTDQTPHITLKLEDAPLRKVMTEVCRQVGWHFARFGTGYNLMPGVEADQRPRCEAGDFQVVLDNLELTNSLSLSLRDPAQGTRVTRQLTLRFSAEADDDETLTAIYNFDPKLTVTTDTGVTLAPLQDRIYGGQMSFGGSPTFQIPVKPPPAEARKLAAIEGDVVLYADITRIEHDFALDQPGTRFDKGELTVKFLSYESATHTAKFELMLPEPPPPQPGAPHEWLQPRATAELRDAAGTPSVSGGYGFSGSTNEGISRFQQTFNFSAGQEYVPTTIRYRVSIQRNATKRVHYRFENVPLPAEPG